MTVKRKSAEEGDVGRRSCWFLTFVFMLVVVTVTPVKAQKVTEDPDTPQPDRIRGQISEVTDDAIVVSTPDGKEVRVELAQSVSIFSLSEASFTDVDFGTYVGAVSVRLNEYSPIVRDSLSWLHHGFELRIFDDELRGIALGHTSWDLTDDTVISHGWVDDLEVRVLSIKYGPTEEEETDVDIPRDVPIHRMSIGDKSLIRTGAHVFAGAKSDGNDRYAALFVLVGQDGVVPAL